MTSSARVPLAGTTGTDEHPTDDTTFALEQLLAAYVRAVAGELRVPVEATGFEISDTRTAYVGLAEQYGGPHRDLMLVWSDRHGWLIAVETDPAEPPVVLAHLGGHDPVPGPRTVARFVVDVLEERGSTQPRPFYAPSDGQDLTRRLARHLGHTSPGAMPSL